MECRGWHGTTQVCAKSIRCTGFKLKNVTFDGSSIRNPNDLGGGIYFFIDSNYSKGFKMAQKYAHQYRDNIAKKQRCQIEVIEVSIQLSDEYLLDLNDRDTLSIFYKFQEKHENSRKKVIQNLRNDGASKRKNYDGIMVELFVKHVNKQNSDGDVQAVIKDTITSFDNITSNFPNGTEVCVRDSNCIAIKNKEKDNGNEFKKFLRP